MKPILLSIIGKPLCGKDTQVDLLTQKYPDAVDQSLLNQLSEKNTTIRELEAKLQEMEVKLKRISELETNIQELQAKLKKAEGDNLKLFQDNIQGRPKITTDSPKPTPDPNENLEDEGRPVQVKDVRGTVIQENEVLVQFSWKVVVQNRTESPIRATIFYEGLDEQGLPLISEKDYRVNLPPGEVVTKTGIGISKPDVYKRVSKWVGGVR